MNVVLYQFNKNAHPPSKVLSVSIVALVSSAVMLSLVGSCDGPDFILILFTKSLQSLYAGVLQILTRSCFVNCPMGLPIAKFRSSTAYP